MSGDCERTESAKVSTVLQGQQAERNDDQENRFFVHMPPEQEGRISTESDSTNKDFPSWLQE